MGLAIFAVCLCFFNIVLWFILFRQFKKTFSPDTILSNISQEVNKLIIEISRETDADLTLIDERRRGLLQLLEKADKRILLAEDELRKRDTEKKVLGNLITSTESINEDIETNLFAEQKDNKKNEIESQSSESKQTDLFDIQVSISDDARVAHLNTQANDPFATILSENRTSENVSTEGAPSKETSFEDNNQEATPIFIKPPLIKPTPKLSFKEQVNELHRSGMSIATIASRLGRTKTEIEIALAVSE